MSNSNDSNDADGPLVTQGYVCSGKGQPFVLQDITLPAMKATYVEIDMQFCGLCRTDVHMRDDDWNLSDFPMCAGHEGVGTVRRTGSAVHGLEVGDTVGITWVRDSCKCCAKCLIGRENICEKGYQVLYGGPRCGPFGKEHANSYGGCFSKVMRLEERFAIKIPEGIPPEVACPLICGGGTVFEVICDYVKPGMHVAVASFGGLATVAVKYAKMFGAHVTVLSGHDWKKDKALAVGANEFYGCLKDPEEMKELAFKFDLIIDTSPAMMEIHNYMDMLKISGIYARVGIPVHTECTFNYEFNPLIHTQRVIAGSIVTGTSRMALMLQMTKDHLKDFLNDPEDWKAEVVPYDRINECMEDLKAVNNKSTYRYLLSWGK